jgi:hypothetical protein
VAVHLVDVEGASRRVVGWTLTRGGSARSTSEPAARAAVELLEGGMSFAGVGVAETGGLGSPELGVPATDAFLALLDTQVYWDVA